MKTVRLGIIGTGLMGREAASAAMRWGHLIGMETRPEIVAICGRTRDRFGWYTDHLSSIHQTTTDYEELLANPDVDAVYAAVPHDLHETVYTAAIRAGKHILGEKPFGIDLTANEAIMACLADHPGVLARCASQFPFFPAVQRIGRMIEQDAFGRIIEFEAGFLHSSDLDPNKPLNWKRTTERNGHYGCMGDLGMHVCHVPFRAGWFPTNVRAVLSNIVETRPGESGDPVPCPTWDNAVLVCEATDRDGRPFPMTLKMQRIAPGERNTWYIRVLGTRSSVRFSTKNPKRLELLEYSGGEQIWGQIDMGHETAFKSITGPIFEFGFSDAILQMWAAFLHELEHGEVPSRFSGCATPEETAVSHRLFSTALESQEKATVVTV